MGGRREIKYLPWTNRNEWRSEEVERFIIYLPNARACLLDHLTSSHPVPTDDVVYRVFTKSSALEQVVAIHPGMATERVGIIKSQAKPVEVYTQEVMSGGWVKADNGFGSVLVPRDKTYSGQGFP
ncbi:hypothetical protein TNCV_1222511 [Trichonephila clavipes]|nr:hypothetical protein TNCV_1222511 [Trichonephila clavipes]